MKRDQIGKGMFAEWRDGFFAAPMRPKGRNEGAKGRMEVPKAYAGQDEHLRRGATVSLQIYLNSHHDNVPKLSETFPTVRGTRCMPYTAHYNSFTPVPRNSLRDKGSEFLWSTHTFCITAHTLTSPTNLGTARSMLARLLQSQTTHVSANVLCNRNILLTFWSSRHEKKRKNEKKEEAQRKKKTKKKEEAQIKNWPLVDCL
jgi:hypothetical protein